jgi:hypothetical protein
MRSASATEVPPNFITTVSGATGATAAKIAAEGEPGG